MTYFATRQLRRCRGNVSVTSCFGVHAGNARWIRMKTSWTWKPSSVQGTLKQWMSSEAMLNNFTSERCILGTRHSPACREEDRSGVIRCCRGPEGEKWAYLWCRDGGPPAFFFSHFLPAVIPAGSRPEVHTWHILAIGRYSSFAP